VNTAGLAVHGLARCCCDRVRAALCDRRESPGGWVSFAAASRLLRRKGAYSVEYTFVVARTNEQWYLTSFAIKAFPLL
jgi:hypothetical protein